MTRNVHVVELAPRVAAALVRHPGVAAARVEAPPGGDRLVARVVAAPGCGRVAAAGRCALIDPSGTAVDAELVDVSWSGVRLRLSGAEPPPVGTEVQLSIEAPALGGGVDGWLGCVRWIRGDELGVAFAGNFDEGLPLIRLVQAFADAADTVPAAPVVDARTRARIDRTAVLHVGTLAIDGRTQDLGVAGVGFRGDDLVHLDLRGRDVRLRVDARGLFADGVPGTVVRQEGPFCGIALRTDAAQARALANLVEDAVVRAPVSTDALCAWLAGAGLPVAVEVRYVDEVAEPA